MVLDQLFVYALVLLLLPSDAYSEADTYAIPITFNPLIQNCVKKSFNTEIFYKIDKQFYSKVTVIDAAKNTEQHVKNVITKTISVVFLTIASSHVSGSLTLGDLRYREPSKWSYTLKVQSILNASNGAISELTDAVVLYKIQESAMRVLEKRYGFSVRDILVELGLTTMEFYGVEEKQWIDVVGIITEKVITDKTEKLNLTTCYLAEMVNKTVAEIKALTLNEVDMYLYNTSLLMDKLPGYRNNVISSLYQTFNITASQLASISNIDISIINTMQLKDVIQVFTTSILKELHVSKAEIIQSDPTFQPEMLLSCKDKWEPFKRLAISKSFDNAAKDMSITSQTLASLLYISYTDVNMFTVNEMINILAILIQPLKEDKIIIESFKLRDVVASNSSRTLNSTKDNAFAAIQMFTHFTTRQLTLLYGWKEQEYQFAKMFSLDDITKSCFLDPNDYSLLTLATINVGEVHYSCKSFNVFREIWGGKSIKDLETKFSTEVLPFDQPISSAITLLTKAPLAISYRPLNITTEEQDIIQKITFNNISAVTTYSDSTLKMMSFQEVIELAVYLYQNGSFRRTVKVVSFSVITSLTPSLSLIPNSSNIPSTTYTSETKSHSKSLFTYQNQMTQFTTKSIQLYSAKLSTILISTFTLNYTPMINVSSNSYSTKMMNKQSSVTRNISQATSVGGQLSYTPGTTLALSSSYILRSDVETRSSSKDDISRSKINIINTPISTSVLPSTITLPLGHISAFSSSRNFATNASEPQSQSSETNSAMFLHSKRFTASNSNQTLSSVTPTPVTFHNVSLSTNHSKSETQQTSYHSTTSPLVITMPPPYSTKTMKSPSLTPSLFPLKTATTNMTLTYALAYTTLATNWTKAMTNTTTIISSPTDSTIAFSNGETDLSTTVSPNSSSPTTISLVIQTTDVQSTISSSIRSSTPIVPILTSTMATTTINHNFISQVSSTSETTVSKTSSDTTSGIFTTVSASYQKPTSTYLPNNTVFTSRTSSLQTYPSPTSKTMNATASIEPSTTKHETMTSSVTNPAVDICQSTTACKDNQACVPDSGHYKCEAVQNLQASFKITKGLTYSPDLLNKKSDAFLNFSRQMEYLIDSVYKKSIYSSNYFGCKVTEFKKGSVIVLYKLLFKNNWSISNSTMQNITNVFKDEVGNIVGNNIVITDISSVQDFNECSSDKTNDCYNTADCNNTIGSYNCFCRSGTTDDGKTCKADSSPRDNDDDVPWIIYVVITIMVVLIIFLIVVLIYCEKKHKKRNRSHLDLYNNGINMYPRSTSYLAETPESEADLADGLGIVNRRGPQPNMVTFNPSPEEKKELETQNGQPGMLLSFKRIDPD